MSKIHMVGPWSWYWVSWHVLRLAYLPWAAIDGYVRLANGVEPTLSLPVLVAGWILYGVLFLPAEIFGAYRLRFNPPGVEIAKTLSQTNQWLAQQGRWEQWVATMSAAIDAALWIMIASPINRLFAISSGGLLGWRLLPHYADRSAKG